MAKTKKRDYVTNGYIEEVNHYIYNDLDLSGLYDRYGHGSHFNEDVLKEILKEGEEYVRLEYEFDHIVVTSKARIINTKNVNQYKVTLSSMNVHTYVGTKKLNMPELFLENDWEFDIEKITKDYNKYKWRHIKT